MKGRQTVREREGRDSTSISYKREQDGCEAPMNMVGNRDREESGDNEEKSDKRQL